MSGQNQDSESLRQQYIDFEKLKSIVEALNKLFEVLFSHDQLAVRGLTIEPPSRRRTLTGRDVTVMRVRATVELLGERASELLEPFLELEGSIEGAGFKAYSGEPRVQRSIDIELQLDV
jgi:hypothetical protein